MVQKTKSPQGARDTKLTILIPRAVYDNLTALRAATGQSTGDLINQLLDSALPQFSDQIMAGREILQEIDRRRSAPQTLINPPIYGPVSEIPASSGRKTEPEPETERKEEPRTPEAGRRIADLTEDDLKAWAQKEYADNTEGTQKKAVSSCLKFVKWLNAENREGSETDRKNYRKYLETQYGTGTVNNHMGPVNSLLEWWQSRCYAVMCLRTG